MSINDCIATDLININSDSCKNNNNNNNNPLPLHSHTLVWTSCMTQAVRDLNISSLGTANQIRGPELTVVYLHLVY